MEVNTIDFVIAWVDGNDENLQKKREQYSSVDVKQANQNTRFASQDEIYFCIASILKYVPYCGKIYVVTDQQTPKWLHHFDEICGADKIKIVDHTVLFKDHAEVLPTFNSLTIETMLWNIPELSQYFIYLNDDFFFNAPSNITDFLDQQKMVIYGHWESNFFKKLKYDFRKKTSQNVAPKYTVAQILSAEMVGLSKYFEIHHRPHIVDKKLLSDFFKQNPDILRKQIQFKFRQHSQFLPVGLSNHLSIIKNQALLKNDTDIAYLKNQEGLERFLPQLKDTEIKFGCIQSLDQFTLQNQHTVQKSLVQKFQKFIPHPLCDGLEET